MKKKVVYECKRIEPTGHEFADAYDNLLFYQKELAQTPDAQGRYKIWHLREREIRRGDFAIKRIEGYPKTLEQLPNLDNGILIRNKEGVFYAIFEGEKVE